MFRRVSLYAISWHVAGTINMIWAAQCTAKPDGPCVEEKMSYVQARDRCANVGWRLCQLSELRQRDCKQVACRTNDNRQRVWTGTACGGQDFMIVSKAKGGKRSNKCTDPKTPHKLRCCQDDVRRLSPLNLSTHTTAANEEDDEDDEDDEDEEVSDRRLEFATPILV